jgi:4-carboxymuconolactone decarboxylase
MKILAASLAAAVLFVAPLSHADTGRSAAPALADYSQRTLVNDLWKRPGLSLRDRSIVTVAALVARNQTAELAHYIKVALDNGVKPGEISGLITHLAFYSGWGNAAGASAIATAVFKERKIPANQIPAAQLKPIDLDQKIETDRAAQVVRVMGSDFPGLADYTNGVLFNDVWRRPDLEPRDRSLVTISALIANGNSIQLVSHLNRAMDSGLTEDQAKEVITHLAFYAGWPNAVSVLPAVRDIFAKRPK